MKTASTDHDTAISEQDRKQSQKRGGELGELVRRFLEYCEVDKGRSALTVRNYRHYLDRFLEFAAGHSLTDPDQIDQEVIHKYRLFLNRYSAESPLGKATQNYHLIALRSWLKYLSKRDIPSLAPEKIDLAATPDRQINFLTLDEVKRLIQAVPASGLIGWRDRSILAFLFSTGLRVAELTGLNRQAVNIETAELQVIGKGGKARLVFLADYAREALATYLKHRRDRDPALFIRHAVGGVETLDDEPVGQASSESGSPLSTKRLTPRSVQRLVRRYASLAGIIQEVHPHTLRHSFATDLLSNGADIRSVQQLLGHASITTTQIYTHVTDNQLKSVHDQFASKLKANTSPLDTSDKKTKKDQKNP